MVIRDTRTMTRGERLAAAEQSDKNRAVERAARAKAHAERNAVALKAQQDWAALTSEERAAQRRARQEEVQARHAEANAAALAKAAPGPPENKMLLPKVQNKVKVEVTEPSAPAPPDATDAARKLAKKHRISLSKIEGTGAGGRITVADVTAAAEK